MSVSIQQHHLLSDRYLSLAVAEVGGFTVKWIINMSLQIISAEQRLAEKRGHKIVVCDARCWQNNFGSNIRAAFDIVYGLGKTGCSNRRI